MRSLIRLAVSALVVALLAGIAAATTWTKIRIGTEGAYPPFNSVTADGSLVGFDIDIARALCREMKVECEFVVQDWDGMIPALLAGRFDAIIASMSITDERKKVIEFTNKYYNTPAVIVVPKDSSVSDISAEALVGKRLGAQSSTTHSAYAEKYFPEADLQLYRSADEYKLDLPTGRIDAVIDGALVVSEWLQTKEGACCRIVGMLTPDPVIDGLGAGIGIRKQDTVLRDMFNRAIEAIRANGEYQEISQKYFGFDVYGG